MLHYLNMNCRVTIGDLQLANVHSFEVNENVEEIADTATIKLPRNWKSLQGKPILKVLKVGDPVRIEAGYNRNYDVEFIGYIREIEADKSPIILHCEDEMYLLRQNSHVKTYNGATLRKVLTDIMPKGTKIDCPTMNVGKLQIDKASTFTALNQIKESYGLYSRYNAQTKTLRVHLRDIARIENVAIHPVTINPQRDSVIDNFIKKNDLRYKRKEDFKLQVEVEAKLPTGEKIKIVEGSRESDANKISFHYAGNHSKAELQRIAKSLYDKRCYDGFTGSLTTFGVPQTHAGDVLEIADRENPTHGGRYFIEKVTIVYIQSWFERRNELSYKFST